MGITDSEDFDIRYALVEDTPFLKDWLKSEEMLHWYPPSTEEEIENFISVWIGFARYKAALTAVYHNEPVGMGVLYLMPYRKVAHQGMFQIIVPKKWQRQGIGTALTRNLIHLAKTRFKLELIHVEILDKAPLIPLLKSLGFTEFAYQERFVKEGAKYFPRILMEKEIS